MSTRILETVLTGRNLLSPVLREASRDVTQFGSQVTRANEQQAGSALASSRAQTEAAARIVASNSRLAQSATQAATIQARASASSATEINASNARLQASVDRLIVATELLTAAQTTNTRSTQVNTRERNDNTLATRANEAAVRSLAGANGFLGTSMSPITAGLGAVALGFGYAAYRGMEFDTAMSEVGAASNATESEMAALRETAITLGADTKYSSEEAAKGITEMAKAGVEVADIMGGGLKGALDLAAAGNMEVADAAEIGATAMNVFNLEGNQMAHVADLLAAGAGKAQGSVHDMGMALNQSALVAEQTGLSIEDTAGALALFASNGLTGSDAGTSFKTMLQALNPNSKEAARAMDAIGFSAYDAQGNFVGLEGVASQLKDGLSGLSVEQQNATLKTIFGSDAVRAAAVLYEAGGEGVRKWTNNVNDAGFAAEYAAKLQDNLRGDLEKLGGAFDAVMTSMGSGAQGPLRELVQMLTWLIETGGDAVGLFTSLPGPVQAAVGAFVALHMLKGPLASLFDRMALWLIATVTQMGVAVGATNGFTLATGAARLAVMSLITTLGPLAAVLAAAFVVKGVVDLTNAGDDARESVKALNAEIKNADTNDARFQATSMGIEDLTGKVNELREKLKDDGAWETTILGAMLTGAKDDAESLAVYEAQLNDLRAATERQASTVLTLGERYKLSKEDVVAFADAHGIDLSGAVDKVQWDFQRLQSAENGAKDTTDAYRLSLAGVSPVTETAVSATQLLGDTSRLTEDQIKNATDTITDWRKELATVGTSFVEPLALYKSQLEDKSAREREAAEATAAATEDSSDSWEDYVTDSSLSLDEWANALEQQIKDQDAWRENIVRITERGGLEVGQAFAAMGKEGASQTAQMANATDADFNRMATLMAADARRGGEDAAAELDTQMRVMAAVGRRGAGDTVASIASQLNIGVDTVRDISKRFGVELAEGVNPLLSGLGKPRITYTGSQINANGRRSGFAEGGYTGDGSKYTPAGIVHAGEYVFTKEQTAKAGVARLEAYANSLNGYATGGFVTAADVPRPPSTSPYQPPISTAGDATMQRGFDEMTAFLKANAETAYSGASGPLGTNTTGPWTALFAAVKAVIPQARVNSAYRPGDPGAHGRNKAVDFGFGSGPGGAGSAGLASINRLLHDRFGGQLYELIYDGIGDDRPDLKSGRPLTYNAATRNQHRNHVHAAVYDQGGMLNPGAVGINLSAKPEGVLTGEQTEWLRRAATPVTAMPGYGMGGGYSSSSKPQTIVVDMTGARLSGTFGLDPRGFLTMIDGRIEAAQYTEHTQREYSG